MQGKQKNIIPLALTMFFIFFITLISRTPTLSRVTHLVPLWSYAQLLGGKGGRQILLNILLFIPLGYFLRFMFRASPAVLISLAVSATIELLQYVTYRGMLDVDDLISNGLGAFLGILVYKFVTDRDKVKKIINIVLLGAGFAGCLMVAVPAAKSNINAQVTKQFWFDASVVVDDGELILDGSCFTYDRATPAYTLLLGEQTLHTTIDGENFSATMERVEEKTELQIRFGGYSPMPTGVYIRPDGSLAYVESDVERPEGVPKDAVLKAYSEAFDTFVYESDGKLLWLIGWEGLDSTTEIIYHIHTSEPEKLPELRIQYKYDNRGFRAIEPAPKELERLGHYRVFEDIIPTDYAVTAIVVGFNTDGAITWNDSFRPT